jgi:hypothetical protein
MCVRKEKRRSSRANTKSQSAFETRAGNRLKSLFAKQANYAIVCCLQGSLKDLSWRWVARNGCFLMKFELQPINASKNLGLLIFVVDRS